MSNYYDPEAYIPRTYYCSKCGKESTEPFEERYSLGIYAGRYCSDKCWRDSGYRDEGPEGYDYLDAGEYYDEDY